MSWEDHGLIDYPDYFRTDWWQYLRDLHIFSNPDACCYICGVRNPLSAIFNRKSILLLHHVSYANLFKEKLLIDLYILCHNCHDQAHFWTFLRWKIPLRTNWLLFSMRSRKMLFYIRSGRFGLFLIWFSIILAVLAVNLVLFILKQLFRLVGALFWLLLKFSLRRVNIDIR